MCSHLFLFYFFKVIFPRRAGLDRKHNVAYIKSFHCLGGKIPGENPCEKPSLGSSRWDSNLWPLTPQSSALTTRPPTTSITCSGLEHVQALNLK